MLKITSQKNPVPADFSFLGADMHSHLVPGVDDGAATSEIAVQLVEGLLNLGFSRLITTPHILPERYPNTRFSIFQGFETLKQALAYAGVKVDLTAAAEYYMDENFDDTIQQADLLTFGTKKYVLIEMSEMAPPQGLEHFIFRLLIKGYQPILAHPERYLFLKNDFSQYERLKERGCLFQANLLSFAGYYGKPAKDVANRLLKANMLDFLGTDLHHDDHLETLRHMAADKKQMKLLSGYEFRNNSL